MKTFHEATNSCFERVQQITDGDYCLVHLYDENEQYKEHFDNAVRKGREVILDNSIFELGTAFDSQDYLQKIKELNPTWYIIPDALEDCDQTLQNFWKIPTFFAFVTTFIKYACKCNFSFETVPFFGPV